MKNNGILVVDTLKPYDSSDVYPVTESTYVKGGHHQTATLTDRDNIPTERRLEGMTCWVVSESKSYRLVGGITNSDWVAETSSFDGMVQSGPKTSTNEFILITINGTPYKIALFK